MLRRTSCQLILRLWRLCGIPEARQEMNFLAQTIKSLRDSMRLPPPPPILPQKNSVGTLEHPPPPSSWPSRAIRTQEEGECSAV